jgi:hypothetical protein
MSNVPKTSLIFRLKYIKKPTRAFGLSQAFIRDLAGLIGFHGFRHCGFRFKSPFVGCSRPCGFQFKSRCVGFLMLHAPTRYAHPGLYRRLVTSPEYLITLCDLRALGAFVLQLLEEGDRGEGSRSS